MPEEEEEDGRGVGAKLALSAVVIVLAIPGLIIEPGPVSELAAIGVLTAIWIGGKDPEDAAVDVTEEAAP